MRKKQPHQFPESLLNQINENSSGFVLFTIDQDRKPCVFARLDNSIDDIGIHNFIRHYAESIETAHSNSVYTSITGDEDQPPEEEQD